MNKIIFVINLIKILSPEFKSCKYIDRDSSKAKTKSLLKPTLSKSSTLMKPTASQLAKQNQPHLVHSIPLRRFFFSFLPVLSWFRITFSSFWFIFTIYIICFTLLFICFSILQISEEVRHSWWEDFAEFFSCRLSSY